MNQSSTADLAQESEAEFDARFKPKGAIAFFVLLVLLAAGIWYGIYLIMISRM